MGTLAEPHSVGPAIPSAVQEVQLWGTLRRAIPRASGLPQRRRSISTSRASVAMVQRMSNTQRYLDVLKGTDRKEVQIGVFEPRYYEADDGGPAEPVAAVAATQELGNPQRSI